MSSKLLIVVLLSLLFIQTFWLRYHNGYDKIDPRFEQWELGAVFLHPEKNECWSTSNNINYKVKIEFKELDDSLGQWNNANNTITFDRTPDVDTIAHEVRHLVDDLMKQYQITDKHYGAYAQGGWTQCVYDLVERTKVVDFINKRN